MTAGVFRRLSRNDKDQVVAMFALLEQAHRAVPTGELPADPTWWAALDEIAARAGRVIVPVGPVDAPVAYTTGYANDIADQLADAGIGILPADQRAVLAVVLLRCVAEPTARGQRPDPWSAAPPVSRAELNKCQIPDIHIVRALAQLHLAGLVHNGRGNAGVTPGPVLDRLTPAQRTRLEHDLLQIAAPDDPVVRRILSHYAKGRR